MRYAQKDLEKKVEKFESQMYPYIIEKDIKQIEKLRKQNQKTQKQIEKFLKKTTKYWDRGTPCWVARLKDENGGLLVEYDFDEDGGEFFTFYTYDYFEIYKSIRKKTKKLNYELTAQNTALVNLLNKIKRYANPWRY